jgi:hypothetical protein
MSVDIIIQKAYVIATIYACRKVHSKFSVVIGTMLMVILDGHLKKRLLIVDTIIQEARLT